MSWQVLRHFAGEKVTVAAIVEDKVQGEVEAEVKGSSSFHFGANKRENTTCFGFPILPMSSVSIVDCCGGRRWHPSFFNRVIK